VACVKQPCSSSQHCEGCRAIWSFAACFSQTILDHMQTVLAHKQLISDCSIAASLAASSCSTTSTGPHHSMTSLRRWHCNRLPASGCSQHCSSTIPTFSLACHPYMLSHPHTHQNSQYRACCCIPTVQEHELAQTLAVYRALVCQLHGMSMCVSRGLCPLK
jgi:hypothetical protein